MPVDDTRNDRHVLNHRAQRREGSDRRVELLLAILSGALGVGSARAELFVGGVELFDGRVQLLVERFELFAGRLHLRTA